MEGARLKIVVGLGNPGRSYVGTRHNIGFAVVDEVRRQLAASTQRSRFRAILHEGVHGADKVILAQPQLYMNLSGLPVREIVNWYKADLNDLLVVYDDMDLPLGHLRMRETGSAGGHNGMKSIISELNSNDIQRLRIGIGRSGGASTAHVLSRFTPDEADIAQLAISEAARAVLMWIDGGSLATMNEINRRETVAEQRAEQ
jgi:peptidyl-tRNA hydrolase, PTH1 family